VTALILNGLSDGTVKFD